MSKEGKGKKCITKKKNIHRKEEKKYLNKTVKRIITNRMIKR